MYYQAGRDDGTTARRHSGSGTAAQRHGGTAAAFFGAGPRSLGYTVQEALAHASPPMAYDRVLRRFRECVRNGTYVLTSHADEEMTADGFGVLDVESGVLTGTIMEKQTDEKTGEFKYRIRGTAPHDRDIELVAKLGPTGKMVMITVYGP